MKNSITPTDLYSSQRLIICLLHYTGFLPLKMSGNGCNRRLKVSVVGYVFSFIYITFIMASFVILSMHLKGFIDYFYDTDILRIGGILQFLNTFIAMIVLYGSSVCWPKRICTCMEIIIKIDRKLKMLGADINYWKGLYLSIYLLIGFLTLNIALSISGFILLTTTIAEESDVELPLWAIWTTYCLPQLAVTIIVIHFTSVTFEIKQRFVGMNRVSF